MAVRYMKYYIQLVDTSSVKLLQTEISPALAMPAQLIKYVSHAKAYGNNINMREDSYCRLSCNTDFGEGLW